MMYDGPVKVCAERSLDKERGDESCPRDNAATLRRGSCRPEIYQPKLDSHYPYICHWTDRYRVDIAIYHAHNLY